MRRSRLGEDVNAGDGEGGGAGRDDLLKDRLPSDASAYRMAFQSIQDARASAAH